MALDDRRLLAALRDPRQPAEVARDAGIPLTELDAARDALLRRHATLTDSASPPPSAPRSRSSATAPACRTSTPPDAGDLYFGLGVAMAQDRLWQMDRLRRRALGRQAEILGPAYAASDIAHLTVGIDLIAEREAAAMDAATRATDRRPSSPASTARSNGSAHDLPP